MKGLLGDPHRCTFELRKHKRLRNNVKRQIQLFESVVKKDNFRGRLYKIMKEDFKGNPYILGN